MNDPNWFPAYFTAAMFVGAVVPKALGVVIAFCLGLLAFYPSAESAAMLVVLFVPAVVLAAFRE